MGKQRRMHMPDNISLNMAIVTTNAEKEGKASGRANRGTRVNVFTVGDNRGVYQEIDTKIDMRNPGGKIPMKRQLEVPGSHLGWGRQKTREDRRGLLSPD